MTGKIKKKLKIKAVEKEGGGGIGEGGKDQCQGPLIFHEQRRSQNDHATRPNKIKM